MCGDSPLDAAHVDTGRVGVEDQLVRGLLITQVPKVPFYLGDLAAQGSDLLVDVVLVMLVLSDEVGVVDPMIGLVWNSPWALSRSRRVWPLRAMRSPSRSEATEQETPGRSLVPFLLPGRVRARRCCWPNRGSSPYKQANRR